MTEELNENEVTEVTEVTKDEQAQIQAEQERLEQERLEQERIEAERQAEIERQEAEERAREQARIEHENFLNSFPETTVFYRDLLVDGNIKKLGMATKDPHVADYYKILDNHFDESELTYIGTPECGIWYLKGYEKPEPTEEEKMLAHKAMIEAQLDAHLLDLAKSKGYDDCKSLATYFNSTKERFRRDGIAFMRYRDDVYDVGYEIIDKCISGEIDYRDVTLEYILNLVDPIDW